MLTPMCERMCTWDMGEQVGRMNVRVCVWRNQARMSCYSNIASTGKTWNGLVYTQMNGGQRGQSSDRCVLLSLKDFPIFIYYIYYVSMFLAYLKNRKPPQYSLPCHTLTQQVQRQRHRDGRLSSWDKKRLHYFRPCWQTLRCGEYEMMRSQCEGLFLSVRWYFRFLFLLLLFLCRFPVGRTTRRMFQFISAVKIDTMRGRGGSDDGSCKGIFWVWVLGSVRVFVYVSFCSANWECGCVFVYLFVSVFYLWWWVRCLSGKHTQKKQQFQKNGVALLMLPIHSDAMQMLYFVFSNCESVLEKVWCFDEVKRIVYLCPFVLRSTIQPICKHQQQYNKYISSNYLSMMLIDVSRDAW